MGVQNVTQRIWPAEGPCTKGICGNDAACRNLPDGSHRCICPHDFTPPTSDLKCPNRRTVTETPQPIPIVIPPSSANTTTNSTVPVGRGYDGPNTLTISLISVFGLAALVFVTLIVAFIYRRCRKNSLKTIKESTSEDETPLSLTKALLDAHKYTNNPQYSTLGSSVKTIPNKMISFHEAIGEGCFGKVYKGELEIELDGSVLTVAIKVLKDSASHEAQLDFMREVEIMSSFNHSNILSLIGISHKEPTKCPWMIFEFMPYGDLTEVLRSNSVLFRKIESTAPLLNQDGLMSIAVQIARGMNYLASQHFVHRDLACRNCLVGENLTVKIADFGMSRDVYTCDYYKIGGSRLLPVRWMSPESITYGRFTLESDVWSYGVVLWEVFSYGKQPYFGHSNDQVVKVILQGTRLNPPDDCPNGIVEIMSSCWILEPRDRITFPCICDKLERLAGPHLPMPPSLSQIARLASVGSPCGSVDSSNSGSVASRSGAMSVISDLDSDCYLKPNPPEPPHEYLQTLSDSPPNSIPVAVAIIH